MNNFCSKCGLYKNVKNPCIWGRGDSNSKLLVLGEAPGATEDEMGLPFVGQSGERLQSCLNTLDVQYFIANAVRCRPTDTSGKNRTPLPTEIDCCKPLTIKLILSMSPKVIVTVGRIPTKQVLGINMEMEAMRGIPFFHPHFNCFVVPTYHPSFLVRMKDDMYVKQFYNDFNTARKLLFEPPKRKIIKSPKSLSNPVDILSYFDTLKNSDEFAFDLETTGTDPKKHKITDISFCCEMGKGVHIRWEDILNNRLYDPLKDIMESNSKKIGHNTTFDIRFMKSVGIDVKNNYFDTMLAYHTLTMSFEGRKSASLYKLKTMSWFLTTEGGHDEILEELGGIKGVQGIDSPEKKPKRKAVNSNLVKDTLFDSSEDGVNKKSYPNEIFTNDEMEEYNSYILKNKKKILEDYGLSPLEYYAAMDSDVTYRIYKVLKPRIDDAHSDVFYNIIMPLSNVLMTMELNGVKIDIPYIEKILKENNEKIERLSKEFFSKVGYEFNLNSTDQLIDVIHNKLKIPINTNFKTAKGTKPSMDERALSFYATKKPILNNILEYRFLSKQNSTYLEGYKNISDEKSRIYPDYSQISTASGRLSSFIHTVPRDNKIRNMIVPENGFKFIIADLSQIELRILAMISQDQNMISAFESGYDFHTMTACKMFGIPVELFDKSNKDHDEKRTRSKNINFGIVYGQTYSALAASLGISENEARDFQNLFFAAYPGVKKWIYEIKQFALKNGYVETIYGRRRYLPHVYSSIEWVQEAAFRQAQNTPIQGGASDITAMALIKLQNWINKNKFNDIVRIVITVHDSIIVEVINHLIDDVSKVLIDCMTKDVPKITIPLKADVSILDKWEK